MPYWEQNEIANFVINLSGDSSKFWYVVIQRKLLQFQTTYTSAIYTVDNGPTFPIHVTLVIALGEKANHCKLPVT